MHHYVLLSGGIDSTTLVPWILEHAYPEHADLQRTGGHEGGRTDAPPVGVTPVGTAGRMPVGITFRYGQKHAREVEAARAVAEHYGLDLRIVDLPRIAGSALTDDARDVPEGRDTDSAAGIAPTYVPARNLLFVAHAASLADAEGPAAVWLGVHHDDHTGYPDCRPQFVEAASAAVRLGTEHEVQVLAPFVHWSKSSIVAWGREHGAPYELTHSCYKGEHPACGVCDTCRARLRAFADAGAEDPLPYAPVTAGE